jgi:hypothetical protein
MYEAGSRQVIMESILPGMIEEASSQEFIAAVGAAYPDSEVIGLIANDTELSTAIHAVVVAEPDALEGFQNILGATDENAFSAEDLQELLNNPIARNALTDVLEVVAESEEFTFAHVTQLMEHHKNGEQQEMLALMTEMGVTPGMGLEEFGEFFQEFMRNPELAINNLVNTLVESGQIPADMANTIRGFAIPMGNLMQGMIQPYHEVAMRHDFSLSAIVDSAEERGTAYEEELGGPNVPPLVGDGAEESGDAAAADGDDDAPDAVDPHAESVDEAALAPEVVDTEVAALSPIRFEGPSGAPIPHSEAVLHAAADGMEAGALANGTYDLAALGITPDVTAAEAARVAAYDAETEALTVTRGATPSALTV